MWGVGLACLVLIRKTNVHAADEVDEEAYSQRLICQCGALIYGRIRANTAAHRCMYNRNAIINFAESIGVSNRSFAACTYAAQMAFACMHILLEYTDRLPFSALFAMDQSVVCEFYVDRAGRAKSESRVFTNRPIKTTIKWRKSKKKKNLVRSTPIFQNTSIVCQPKVRCDATQAPGTW